MVPGAIVWCAAYLWYATAVDTQPSFLAEWLPGQILSGIGVGATLPILGSAALAAVPGGRFATASAVVSSTRQLGGVLGIAVLVVIIGAPTPLTTVDVLRDGWLFCAGCFALAAVGALLLGSVGTSRQVENRVHRDIDVHIPEQRVGSDPEPDAETLLPTRSRATETFFDRLPENVRRDIEASGSRVDLAAGAWLFQQGETAESMYVVVSGRLDVVVDGAAVRELGPGAGLGELALLTGGRRSASVRARRDTSLLALSRSQFMGALEHSPETAVAVATALAETLATSRPPEPDRAGPARVIAVVGLRPGDPVAAVARALGDGLARHLDVLVSAGLSAQELALAEQQHDRVVLVAGADQLTWWQSCVRQSDRVVVVGDSNSGVEDRLLVDGCVLDNLPVGTLLERDEGPIIAVNIGSGDRPAAPGSGPRVPGLGDTLLRLMTIGGQGTAQRARDEGAFVITPPSLGVGMMEFHQLDRMVEAGRMAARALLDATGGDLHSAPQQTPAPDSLAL